MKRKRIKEVKGAQDHVRDDCGTLRFSQRELMYNSLPFLNLLFNIWFRISYFRLPMQYFLSDSPIRKFFASIMWFWKQDKCDFFPFTIFHKLMSHESYFRFSKNNKKFKKKKKKRISFVFKVNVWLFSSFFHIIDILGMLCWRACSTLNHGLNHVKT